MRNSLVIGVALAFAAATAATAQTPPAADGPQNKAVKSTDQQVSQPVKGANSFTEGEAKSRIENRGFTNVTSLKRTITASGAAVPARTVRPSMSASITRATWSRAMQGREHRSGELPPGTSGR